MKQLKLSFLLTLLMSMCALSGNAMVPDDGDHFYVFTTQSSLPVSYTLKNLRKITFTDDKVQIWQGNTSTGYAYDRFRFITFSSETTPTGISTVETSESANHSSLATGEGQGEASVYDLQGRKLDSPKRGLNIIRMPDGTTRKVMIQ